MSILDRIFRHSENPSVNRSEILEAIRTAASENGGKTVGQRRFEKLSGIKESTWKKYWPRLSQAIKEAGLEPNSLSESYEPRFLYKSYAEFARELGKLPTRNDLQWKVLNCSGFPSVSTFEKVGPKARLVRLVRDFCISETGFEGVIALCDSELKKEAMIVKPEPRSQAAEKTDGFVYLVKFGRFYKIGKSNSVGRRSYELALQLPDKLNVVHRISTDDPDGIESYWHRRFAEKRRNGEWFDLNAQDVAAFKRRKMFM